MLEDLKPYERVRNCRVRTILDEELNETDRAIFEKAVGDLEGFPHNYLARMMTEKGILLSDKSLTNHRQKRCSC